MRMQPIFAPALTRLVRGLAKKVPGNARVFAAFKEYGEFTDEQARTALEWGTSPELRVGPLKPTVWGNTPDGADHFTLNEIIVEQFEDVDWSARNVLDPYTSDSESGHRRLEWATLAARAELSIEALILHETVHWGDGQTYPGSDPDKYLHEDNEAKREGFLDRGHQFVQAAYGSRLGFKLVERRGRQFKVADHEIPGWLGTVKIGGDFFAWRPLSYRGPGPVRPPGIPRPGSRMGQRK